MRELIADLFISLDGFASGANEAAFFGYDGPDLMAWVQSVYLRTAVLQDVPFLADVVIRATLAQGRFPSNVDLEEYRTGYEEWTRETVLGDIPDCTLSVIEQDGIPHAQRFYKRLRCEIREEDEEQYHLEYRPLTNDRQQ